MIQDLLATKSRLLAATALLRLYGLWKIPLVYYLRPTVVEWTTDRCVLRIRLKRRTKNQLGSMFFAALAGGADLAAGFFAIVAIHKSKQRVSMVFKDVEARFFRRADGDVYFTCTDGVLIADLVEKTLETGERQEAKVQIVATVPDQRGAEPTAKFSMTLSVKAQAQQRAKAPAKAS